MLSFLTTLSLLFPPPSTNIIGCKWVFRTKRNSDGSISRYKTRLVAKCFHQRPGVDLHETFCLVVKPTTIRIFLTLIVHNAWPIHSLTLPTSFFMAHFLALFTYLSLRLSRPQHPDHVCFLRKAIYGLR